MTKDWTGRSVFVRSPFVVPATLFSSVTDSLKDEFLEGLPRDPLSPPKKFSSTVDGSVQTGDTRLVEEIGS